MRLSLQVFLAFMLWTQGLKIASLDFTFFSKDGSSSSSSLIFISSCHLLFEISSAPSFRTTGGSLISFTNNSSRIPFELENGTQIFIPQEKHFYLFPARLSHAVNPFTCSGERRTISFNINTVISEK